ncbi:MAG: hypothetical protein AMXMBFR84_31360 [Candidatus Hydrogenedentota bacterium]
MVGVLSLTLAALFDVQTVPVESGSPHIFLARFGSDEGASVFVLNGNTLAIWPRSGAKRDLLLPEHTSAVDVADLDSDGRNEVIVIAGEEIQSVSMTEPFESRNIATRSSVYTKHEGSPFPRVLVVQYQSAPALALPTDDSVVYLNAAGEEIASISLEAAITKSRWSFLTWQVASMQGFDPGEGLEFSVWLRPFLEYKLPTEARANRPLTWSTAIRGDVTRVGSAGASDPESWSSFGVSTNLTAERIQAYCAVDTIGQHTFIHIRQESVAAANLPTPLGPARRYPGTIVCVPDRVPDFNGDGYGDVLFWTTDGLGSSVDAIMKSITGREWPVRLTAHLYNPAKGRIDPKAVAVIENMLPLDWWFSSGQDTPIRNLILGDFNGDGSTDLAGSTDSRNLAVWIYNEGFQQRADEIHAFPEPIIGLAFMEDLQGRSQGSIGLRGKNALYVLHSGTGK